MAGSGRSEAERLAAARALVERVRAVGSVYHQMELAPGVLLPGEFDLHRHLPHYGLPADLRGKTALDVGTATGFLAFECARRGAQVTAVDLWDEGLFGAIRDVLGLEVRYVQKSIYDLEPSFGTFDLVVCGSLLVHLPDIFGAVQRLRAVCRGQAIITTSTVPDLEALGRPVIEFHGAFAEGVDGARYGSYWGVSSPALVRMMVAAGFREAARTGGFLLESEPGRSGHRVPHVVVHGRV